MSHAARLLGFAFANADLLLEVAKDGAIVFATGAAREFSATDELAGTGLAQLFDGESGLTLLTKLRALPSGGRDGPLSLKLASGNEVGVALCRLPQNGEHISCTMTRPGSARAQRGVTIDAATGLRTANAFLESIGQGMAPGETLSLIDIPALTRSGSREKADGLLAAVARAVKSVGARTVGRVGETSFGAVGPDGGAKRHLAAVVRKMLHDTHMDAPGITEALVSMSGQGLSAEQRMLAVRYCVGRFTAGHHGGKPGDDLAEIFRTMMAETQARAEALTETVAKSAFDFAYQPIVNLKSGALAHCEALVRFHSGSGAGETVGFAEALGISEPFDLAVAAKVIREVEKTPDTRVAFNLSARTIGDPMTFGLISGLLAQKRAMRSRVLIEVTETAQLTDLAKANAAIQSLREIGFQVGIDDFGAGAASLQYLHAMLVDFVKFDGGLVARIGASRREDKLLEGLVSLCSELGVETVAECLETEAQTTRAREMGFTLGQGHYFGKAMPEIAKNAPEQRVAKRKGVQVSWS